MVPVSIVDAKTNMPSMVLGFRNSIVVIVEQNISADLHPMGNQMCHSDEENCRHSTGKTVKMSMAFVTLELSISFFCLPTYPDALFSRINIFFLIVQDSPTNGQSFDAGRNDSCP